MIASMQLTEKIITPRCKIQEGSQAPLKRTRKFTEEERNQYYGRVGLHGFKNSVKRKSLQMKTFHKGAQAIYIQRGFGCNIGFSFS